MYVNRRITLMHDSHNQYNLYLSCMISFFLVHFVFFVTGFSLLTVSNDCSINFIKKIDCLPLDYFQLIIAALMWGTGM
jgi:hypothetical protein